MLLKFYQNTLAAISRWFETIQLGARPKPVRIRIDQSTQAQQIARQQRRLAIRYRR